ncbi:hypothetical protein ES705_23876 [subsurface metagenome]
MKEKSVEITKENLLEFVESLKDRLKVSKKDIMKGTGTFDKRARTFFANKVRKWFHHRFDVAPEDYVFVEGDEYNIKKEYRKHKFFNSPTNPDAAIIAEDIPFKIAIELDHGNYGSNVRMALAKASYSVLLGKTYDQAVVFFFVDSPKRQSIFTKIEKDETDILDRYKKDDLNTIIHII